MPFPSINGSAQRNLSESWSMARAIAGSVKTNAQSLRTQSQAGPVNAERILSFATDLAEAKLSLDSIASTQGLAAYAQEQIGNPSLDIAAEYAAMAQQIDATINWIVANTPKDQSGYLLVQTILANGRTSSRQFSTIETATLRTQLDALIATID